MTDLRECLTEDKIDEMIEEADTDKDRQIRRNHQYDEKVSNI